MTELDDYETFFAKVHDDFDKIYQKKLGEHKHAISVGLNESEYTEGYGKIGDGIFEKKDRYIVHSLGAKWNDHNDTRYTFTFAIDNWGDFQVRKTQQSGYAQPIYTQQFSNKDIGVWNKKCALYRLPNILIELVKKITIVDYLDYRNYEFEKILVPLMTEICNMAEHYYKKFTKYESLYKSDRLTSYDELLISHTKMECELTHKIAELEKSVEYWKNKYETSDEQVRLDAQEKELVEYRKQEHEKSIEMERITKKCERLEEIVRTYKQFAKNVKQYQVDSNDES